MTPTTDSLRLTPAQATTLTAICDTFLPALDSAEAGAVGELWRRGAGERGIPQAIAVNLTRMRRGDRAPILALVDVLSESSFADADPGARAARLRQLGDASGELRFAVRQLQMQVFGLLFGTVDADGRNEALAAVGHPGPVSAPPTPEQAPKTLPLIDVGATTGVLDADVCVVGSGAGGAVIAARLAQAGRSVIVLEAGGYRNEADFRQVESDGAAMYLGGGVVWSELGEIGVLAGATLGGGTVINSMVCLPTPARVREDWTRRGLAGLDGPGFDACIDRVWQRLSVNTEATHYNRNTQGMIAGLQACGYGHERLPRNASLDDDPRFCGYCNAGCQQGCKQSTLRTYLEDAAAAGARFIVDCRAERVLTSEGRATGVQATVPGPNGPVDVEVRAGTVVVAAGGIESPALLLRSGIGGPAVGQHLQLHPAWMVTGVYQDPIRAWEGQVQAAASFDLTEVEDGVGFLVETLGLSPATWAGCMPFVGGAEHRAELLKLAHMASWHAISHDHGSGQVTLDEEGRAVVRWRLEDPVDQRVAARAHVELAQMHRAAGATEIFSFHWREHRWRLGDDFDGFLDGLRAAPPEHHLAFSAHQMSGCRMGSSPADSVADGDGQLHDVAGVWIGDGSALPSAPGVNPMITIMALAERTAQAIADRG